MKIFKSALVLTLVGIACGLLIGTVNYFTEPIIQENIQKEARKAYEGFFPDNDITIESEVIDFKDGGATVTEYIKILENDKLIGHAFQAKGDGFDGEITIVVAANEKGELIGAQILSTSDTPGFYDRYEGKEKHLIGIKGDDLSNLDGIDFIGGASTTGRALDEMLKAVSKAALEYIDLGPELNDYELMFGQGAVATEDVDFVGNDEVIKKEEVKDAEGNVVGHVYFGVGTTTEVPGKADGANLTIMVGVGVDGKAKGLFVVDSEHTRGFAERYNGAFADQVDLGDLVVDKQAGSTVSYNIIQEIVNAIKGMVE